ncbi:hypothetical protein GCM10007242_41210 [Pigmentiphaga litoralis]|uniref:hypothetical protein n=1 Tax=Pigmentiphaga litoralis TaxID=516702 RepID=UPI001679F9D0|nr:hypothetical protein [Pigmentiphaga litoralis]GGX30360.1 hypothetical protein GCM10007242_41210 [Pigmentiphaga litoralis]
MESQNVVSIARAYGRQPGAHQVTQHQYVEVLRNRDMYRRLYDQNTAALSQARGELYAAQQQIKTLERELDAHRAGEPLAILGEAMTMLTDMVTDTREDERALGAVGVRLPAASTQHVAAGEALISRAAPLLSHVKGAA